MSSIFEVGNSKNEAILRDFLQVSILTTSKTKQFCETSFKNGKWKWCQVIRRAASVTQNHLSKPEDPVLQNATSLRKSAPWPPNISHEHVSCIAPAARNASFQILFKCFAPQRCTLFRHLNFQKCSDHGVFCTFWLGNVLRATTTACTFSTYQLPKVVWDRQFFTLLTSKCASRHSGVQTLHLSSGGMAPRPPRAYFLTLWSHKSLEKHHVSPLCCVFAPPHLLSSDFLFSDLHFSALLFSDSSRRRFLRQSHIITIIITHIVYIYIYNIYIYIYTYLYIYIYI